MLNISEQFANAGKQSFQSHLALLQKIGQKTFESTQKIIALNISTGKTLLGDHHEVTEHWIHSKHPFEFWAKDVHELQPGLHHLFHYERELAHILTNAQAELLTFALSEVVEVQNELVDLTSHLHEQNKAKQDVVQQAAQAYSAEIKSLYPLADAVSKTVARATEKPVQAVKAASRAVAKNVAEAKSATKPASKAEGKAKPTAKGKAAAADKAGARSTAKTSAKQPGKESAKAQPHQTESRTHDKPAAKPTAHRSAGADKLAARTATSPQAKNAPKAGKPAAKAANKPHAASQTRSTPATSAKAGKPAGEAASKAEHKPANKPEARPVVRGETKADLNLKARPLPVEAEAEMRPSAEESHRPPMPRPAIQHKLEVHSEAPAVQIPGNQNAE